MVYRTLTNIKRYYYFDWGKTIPLGSIPGDTATSEIKQNESSQENVQKQESLLSNQYTHSLLFEEIVPLRALAGLEGWTDDSPVMLHQGAWTRQHQGVQTHW
jgi:hypothetical protein